MPELAELERDLADLRREAATQRTELERDLGAERIRVDFLERRMPSDRGGKPLLIGDGHPHAQAIEGRDGGVSQGFGYVLDATTGLTLTRSGRILTLAGHAFVFRYSITVEDPTSSEDISIAFTNVAITITEMRAVLIGSATPSVTWKIRHHATDRNNAGNAVVTAGTTTTSTTTGDDVASFDDATIPADSFIWLETTAKSGTVTEIHITLIGTVD